jgi:hypothetical protein
MTIGQQQLDVDNGTMAMYVDNDGDDGNGRDSNGNGNGDNDGNGNDAGATANGSDVKEDNGGNSRTAIGQRQLDNENGMTTM